MGGPPEQLNERHNLMAYMVAIGQKPSDIASILKISPNRISIIKGSPLFKALVRKKQEEISDSMQGNLLDKISGEALPSVEKIVEIRDYGDDPKDQLSAAKELLAYSVSKKHEVSIDETKTIRFETQELREMFAAFEEDSGKKAAIDVTPSPDKDDLDEERIKVKTIDEFCDEYTFEGYP
ncbi:hypothetical protein IIA15_00380 [candidate division TA06 bacterium]|nr:hypothetical protein [candidate division TA06 bacterium]